jgi:hypothetical protein
MCFAKQNKIYISIAQNHASHCFEPCEVWGAGGLDITFVSQRCGAKLIMNLRYAHKIQVI